MTKRTIDISDEFQLEYDDGDTYVHIIDKECDYHYYDEFGVITVSVDSLYSLVGEMIKLIPILEKNKRCRNH